MFMRSNEVNWTQGLNDVYFFGYSRTKKGYRCYNMLTQKLYISINVTFNALEMFYHTKRAQPDEQAIHQCNNMDLLMYPRSKTWCTTSPFPQSITTLVAAENSHPKLIKARLSSFIIFISNTRKFIVK